MTTPFADLDYAHDHYDHAARQQDPSVNLPLNDLAEKEQAQAALLVPV